MLQLNEKIQINNLIEAGYSIPAIARKLERSTATIYNYQKTHGVDIEPVTITPEREVRVSSKLEPYLEYLHARMRNNVYNGSKLYRELTLRGYTGTYMPVNRYVKANRKTFIDDYKPSKQVLTGPGEQAQVDWGSFGRVHINGKEEKLYAFVYVLAYSRALYIEFVVRQNQKTLQECHIHAFEKLGIPKTIVYDNMKTVVLFRERTTLGSKPHFNPAFIDFARYYNFDPFACPPYWPRTKGKVESGVKYVRNNFMLSMLPKKEFVSLEDLNQKARQWIQVIANQRTHGSTKEKPQDLWFIEKDFLHFPDHDRPPYNTSMLNMRHSTKDGLVQYKSCFYSVPREYSLKKLYVRDVAKHGLPTIEIYHLDKLIATHPMSFQRGRWITNDEHLMRTVRRRKRFSAKRKTSSIKYRRPRIVVAVRDLNFYNLLLKKKKYGTKKS